MNIHISKVKNQFKLLYNKKIKHNVFSLRSGGSVTWIVNCQVCSLILSECHEPQAMWKKRYNVFVTWPRNRNVIWLCVWWSLNLSTHPNKFGGHMRCGWGNMTFWIITWLQARRVTRPFGWGPLILGQHPAKF